MSDFSVESGICVRSSRQSPRFGTFRRSGEALDALVFLIAALLIPAWLLGHLFLSFYPAPKTNDSTIAAAGLFGAGSDASDAANDHSSGDDPAGSEGSGTQANAESNDGSGTRNPELDALSEKSTLLQSEVETLTSTNDQLKTQIEQLQAAASQAPAATQADTTAINNELKTKLDSHVLVLNSTKQSLADAEEQCRRHTQEKQQLQTQLSDLQSKLQQTEADLASATQPKIETPASPFAAMPGENSAAETNAKMLEEQKAIVNDLSAKVQELSLNLRNTNQTLTQREEELRQTKLALDDIQAQNGDLKTALDEAKRMAVSSATAPAASTTPPPSEGSLKLMPREDYRDFVSSKGSISKMAFIRWEGDDIIVRSFSNKRLYRLTLNRFSEADQQYLLERKK